MDNLYEIINGKKYKRCKENQIIRKVLNIYWNILRLERGERRYQNRQ